MLPQPLFYRTDMGLFATRAIFDVQGWIKTLKWTGSLAVNQGLFLTTQAPSLSVFANSSGAWQKCTQPGRIHKGERHQVFLHKSRRLFPKKKKKSPTNCQHVKAAFGMHSKAIFFALADKKPHALWKRFAKSIVPADRISVRMAEFMSLSVK